MKEIESIKGEQMALSKKYNAAFLELPNNLKVGISRNVKDGARPVHGLRHPPEGDTTGWYIWGGEEYSEDPDFFVPLHVEHLKRVVSFGIKIFRITGWLAFFNNRRLRRRLGGRHVIEYIVPGSKRLRETHPTDHRHGGKTLLAGEVDGNFNGMFHGEKATTNNRRSS